MLSIVEQWLKEKLGIVLKDSTSIGRLLQDGRVIGMLLEKYGLLSESQLGSLRESSNLKECFENLLSLRKWLTFLDFHVEERDILEIAEGRNHTALKFFYQLYLKLENFYLIRNKYVCSSEKSKLQVTDPDACDPLCDGQPLTEQGNNLLIALRNKYKLINEKYRSGRGICNHSVGNTFQIQKGTRCDKLKDMDREIERFEQAQRKEEEMGVPVNTADQFFHRQMNVQAFEKEKVLESIGQPLDRIKAAEEEEFLNQFVEKVMQQSKIEREMGEMMHRLKHQQNVLLNTKHVIDEISGKQRGRSLMALLEDFSRTLQEKELARQQKLEAERKEESLAIERRLIHNECSSIMQGLICLTLKVSRFKHNLVPKELWQLWKQEFIKDECNQEDDIDYDLGLFENGSELSFVSRELDRQETLVKADLHDYLHYERHWATDLAPEPLQETLGFIVTRLLGLLSLDRVPPMKANLPAFRLAVSLHGIPEKFYTLLKDVFKKSQVLFLLTEELLNDAVLKYKQATNLVEIVEHVSLATNTSKMKNKNSTRKRDIKIADKKSENFENGDRGSTAAGLTKETQTPAVLPEPDFAPLSSSAELGQKIMETLLLGNAVSPELTVQVLLSALSESAQWKGWVIVNFPSNIAEVCELESNLKGQIVPLKEDISFDDTFRVDPMRKSELVPYRVNVTREEFTPYLSHLIHVKSDLSFHQDISPRIIKFYSQFNCYREYQCEQEIDLELILSVIRFVLSFLDPSALEKSFSEIFEGIDLSEFVDKTDKRNKNKNNGGKKDKGKSEKLSRDFEKALPEGDDETLQGESIEQSLSEVKLEGFHEFEAPPSFLLPLARTWQTLESNYLKCLQNSFFLKRIENSKMLAFGEYVNDLFDDCLKNFVDKQEMVDQFVVNFNSIPPTQRCNLNTKHALHKRIVELQNKLWEMCDENKRRREESVHLILKSDWFVHHMNTACHVYASILNEEIQRHVDTMQLIADYYLLSLKKIPSENRMKISSKHIDLTEAQYSELHTCIKYVDDEGFSMSFVSIHEPIRSIFAFFERQIAAMKEATTSEFADLEENVRKEMNSAISDEEKRTSLRIALIKEKLFAELEDFESWFSLLLNSQFEKMKTRYENEVNAVTGLAKVLAIVVEEETCIDKQLCLREDQFFVGDGSVKLSAPLSDLLKPLPLIFKPNQYSITPHQIERLQNIFQKISPRGIVSRSAFLYVLQDVQVDKSFSQFLPDTWQCLSGDKLNRIVTEMFGDSLSCDWKDFIIYAFEIAFPSLSQLMTLVKALKAFDKEDNELIYNDDFFGLTFWFEEELAVSPEATLHLLKFKQTLFKLFQADDYRTNYSNLLFHLCKDEDPLVGFAKALSVVSGHGLNVDLAEDESATDQIEDDLYSTVSANSLSLRKVSYKLFHKTMVGCFQFEILTQTQLPEDINDCLEAIKKKFSEGSLCSLYELLQEPCLLKLIQTVRKFKAFNLGELVAKVVHDL